MWYENGTNVVRKKESEKYKGTAEKKKIELFLGKNCAKISHHNDAKKKQKMKQKDVSLIGAKRAKKEPKKEPNEKLVLTKNRRESKSTYLLSQNGAKMAQNLAQKVSTNNKSIMSQKNNHLKSFIFNKLLIRYNINGFSFNLPVVGSISKPKASKTITPSKALSIISEIQTGKTSSLFFSFISALPLSTFTIPAPVNISSVDEGDKNFR